MQKIFLKMTNLIYPRSFNSFTSRLFPGIVALFLLSLSINREAGTTITNIFQERLTTQSVLVLSFFIAGYLLGLIVESSRKYYLNYFIVKIFPGCYNNLRKACTKASPYSEEKKKLLVKEIFSEIKTAQEADENAKFTATFLLLYNWLQTNKPKVLKRYDRIRFKYRVNANISIIMLAAMVLHLLAAWDSINIVYLIVLLAGAFFFSWLHAVFYRKFEWSIINHYCESKIHPKVD